VIVTMPPNYVAASWTAPSAIRDERVKRGLFQLLSPGHATVRRRLISVAA